jgi:hypothetical protein
MTKTSYNNVSNVNARCMKHVATDQNYARPAQRQRARFSHCLNFMSSISPVTPTSPLV